MAVCPDVDPASPLPFAINAAGAGSDADTKREVIETTLRAAGRRGELLFSRLVKVTEVRAARA